MLIVNQKQIEAIALRDGAEEHPMRKYAMEYKKGIEVLRKTFGEQIRFKRPKFPKRTKGLDHRNKEVPNMALPTPPLLLPLSARIQGEAGLEIWEYCEGQPKLLPNGLWEATGKRSKFITDAVTISLNKDPELAFFIYYKSPLFSREGKNGRMVVKQLIIDDPNQQAKIEGDKERAELELKTALYGVLQDGEQLNIMAQAYGVATDKKHPDAIRKELKDKVMLGEKQKKRDPMAKGVREFLDELKVTDAVRLRSLLTSAEKDMGMIKFFPNGEYKIGDRVLCKVPIGELTHKEQWLANHLHNPANRPKLQDLLRDIATKEYLDKISDSKQFFWLARMLDLKVEFKSKEEIKEMVYNTFVQDKQD